MIKKNVYLDNSENVVLNNNLEISSEQFVSQAKIDEVLAVVDSLDFTPISFKLEAEYAWSKESLALALPLYKQWLVLQACYDDYSIAPSTFD
ncbi:MAG: hypothetical protein Q9M36_05725 [Sulfurovum sp.]|nr:hypothetical protein [Sulfurovum sp.]